MAYGLTQSADLESSSSQYFSRADTVSLSITGDITIEGWVKFESTPGSGTLYPLVSKWNTTGDQRSYLFGVENNFIVGPGPNFFLNYTSDGTGGTNTYGYVAWTPSTGVWYHIAGTCDVSGPTFNLYIDGVAQSVTTVGSATAIYDGTANTDLGSRNAQASTYFDGRMSLVRVWSTVRSQANIEDNMCNVLGSTTNLAAEWTLDNTVNDNSGNSNTLTNNNSVTFGADVPAVCVVPTPTATSSIFLPLLGVG